MYEILFKNEALKFLEALESDSRGRIILSLQRIRTRPYSFVEKLSGTPYYKLKIGVFRAVLDIDKDELIVLAIRIGHRKNIYKKL